MKSALCALLCLLLFSFQSEAETKPVRFNSHLSVNLKVEEFTNALFEGLLPELSDTEFRFQRNENGDILNEMGSGRLNGRFKSSLVTAGEASEITMNISMEIEREPEMGKEYLIQLRSGGIITNPTNAFNYLHDSFDKSCEIQAEVGKPCEIFGDVNPELPPVENALLVFENWKAALLAKVEEVDEPQFNNVKADFIRFLDENIKISKDHEAHLEVSLTGWVDVLGAGMKSFLQEKKLIDYNLPEFSVTVSNQEINFHAYLNKLHVISSFNARMELSTVAQEIIESKENGLLFGKSFRVSPEELTSQIASKIGYVKVGFEAIRIKTFGSVNDVEATEEEQDLGLE